jgi:cobalt-zinc-cadmium efflux system outer membrane protein
MKGRRSTLLAVAGALLLAGCASVPSDGGLGDVQQVLRDRSGPSVEWRPEPSDRDDDRVRAMLGGELDAEKAVAAALINNPRVQIALAELGIARADLIAASTIRNPILGGEIRFPGSPARPYEVTITQTLFDLAQLPRRRQAGRSAFEAAKLRVAGQVLDFAAEVRADYYGLLAAMQKVSLSRTILEAAASGAELAQGQHAAGNITDLDLENEQARYEQAKLDLARSEEDALLRRETIIRAMGLRDASIELTIAPEFPPPRAEEDAETDLLELAKERRLDVAAARREVEALERLLPASRLREIGDLDAGFHVEREPNGERTSGPALELPLPIFNRGRAGRERATAELIRSRQRLALLDATVGSELRSARERLLAARARVEYYRDVVLPRRERIVALTQLEHNAMQVGVFQLLQAKQNEADARRDYIEAQRDYWIARGDLDRAVNGGGGDLAPVTGIERSNGGREGD